MRTARAQALAEAKEAFQNRPLYGRILSEVEVIEALEKTGATSK